MDLRQLNYFVKVIELGSFTRASETVHISQPAIGEQIKNLELELGATLLIRHSRGVEPTESGRILFIKARAILEQVNEAQQAVREYEKGLRGEVTFGLTPGLGERLATPVLEQCSREYPGVCINVVEDLSSSLIRRVAQADEAVKLAIVSGYDLPSAPGLTVERLFVEPLYAVSNAETLGRSEEGISFVDLLKFRLILLGRGTHPNRGLRGLLERLAKEHGASLSVAYEIQAASVAKQLAQRGIGVTILSRHTLVGRLAEGNLVARPIHSPAVIRELNLIWSSQRPLTPAQEAIRNVVAQQAAALRGGDQPAT